MATAQLLYQFRDRPVEVAAWDTNGRINNHFELTRPYDPAKGAALLVTRLSDKTLFARRSCKHREIGRVQRPDGFGGGTDYRLLLVTGPC